MISNQIFGILFPSKDQVFVEIGIESAHPVDCIIVRSENVKATLNDMPHLKKFVKKLHCETLEKVGLTLLGEHDESVKTVFPQAILDLFVKYSAYIHMIHFTDQYCYAPYPNVLKITINIGESAESLDGSSKLFDVVCNQLIDHLAKIKLSEIGLNVAKKNREAEEKKKASENQKKIEEDAQKRKDEKLLAERERVTQLGPAERAKWDEKQKKKELKAQSKRGQKVVKF